MSSGSSVPRVDDLPGQLVRSEATIARMRKREEHLAHGISHDLRAPLRHIAGFADKLGQHLGEQADEKSQHYLQVIGNSARRMSTLIDDLLVYSRLGRGAA